MRFVTMMGLVAILTVSCCGQEKAPQPNPAVPALVQEINRYRVTRGLTPYEFSPELQKAAQRHADDMSKNNFLGHTGTDGSSFSQRAREAGFRGTSGGEIAAPVGDPAEAVKLWKASPGHHAQMLSSHRYIGAATAGKNAAVAVFFSK